MGWFSKRSDNGVARPISLPGEPTDLDIHAAVSAWIDLMARGDYDGAVASVFADPPPAAQFRDRVETYAASLAAAHEGVVDAFGKQGLKVNNASPAVDPQPKRSRVIPASADVICALEIHRDGIPEDAVAWLGFHVPLEHGFGIWTTMGVLRAGDRCILEFEMFHL
jgi:hypothetical protein